MKPAAKLAAYGLSLAVVFTGTWAVGSAVGPQEASTPTGGAGHHVPQTDNRGGTGPTPIVAPARPSEPTPRHQSPAIVGDDVTALDSAPASVPFVPAVTVPQPAASQSRGGGSPEVATAAEPVWKPSESHDRRGVAGGHKVGRDKTTEHSGGRHSEQRRREGRR